jgi:hypothetical protein
MASGEGQGNGWPDVTGRGVQSAEVGGRILVAMVQAGRPLMLRDLAGGADVTPAQAAAYLVSFRAGQPSGDGAARIHAPVLCATRVRPRSKRAGR